MTKDIIQSTTDQYINHGFQWSAFWLNAVNPKPEWLQRPLRRRKDTFKSQWELKVKQTKLIEVQQNASNQVVLGFSFVFDWLREWCTFCGPITEWSKAKIKQSWIIFNTQLKIAKVHAVLKAFIFSYWPDIKPFH